MSAKQYFKYAYLCPLVLPFMVLLIETLIRPFMGWHFGQLTGLLLGSVFFGGIPYLIFLIGFYQWIKEKNGTQIHFASYLFPVFYLLVFLIWLIIYILIIRPENFDNIFSLLSSEYLWDAYFTFGKIAVVVAYSYIFLINLGYWVLKICKMLPFNSD